MRKWIVVLVVLFISSGFSIWAYLWTTPPEMQKKMARALAREPVWAVRAEGALEQGQLYLDLLKRGDGAQFARISYPPLKLLNNQWIEIRNPSQPPLTLRGGDQSVPPLKVRGGGWELWEYIRLTKRLTSLRNIWRRAEHFEFSFNAPQLVQGTGTVWIDGRTRLPQEATLEVAQTVKPSSLHLVFTYQDPTGGLPLNARSLEEILAQLEEVAKARNGKPKKLTPLGEARTASEAFAHDFDHDGLSDALELFYGTDPANPDTDNDTHLDGVEVEGGYDPAGEGRLSE